MFKLLKGVRFSQVLLLCGAMATALTLVGCVTPAGPNPARVEREREDLRKRQEASLLGPGPNTIQGEPAKVFVGNRRWMIVPKSSVVESTTDKILSVELQEHYGTATPLTADGYFLTAAHVIESEVPVALNNMDPRPARVVKLFPDADLALIKFPFTVKRYCERLDRGVGEGDYVYSASAKGAVNRYGIPPWKDGARSIECELPCGSGQSGGPVLNGEGELVGVIVAAYQMRFTRRMSSDTLVSMVEPDELRWLIENDRNGRSD